VLAATPVTVFVPLARAGFEETLRQLRGGERPRPPRVNLGLAPLKPMDLLEALVTPAGRRPEPALSALTDEGWRAALEGRRWLWYARGRQIAPRDELFGVTSPFRLPGELPDEPEQPEEPEEPEEPEVPDGQDRNELERSVRVWAANVGEEQALLDLRERSNDVGRERVHELLGELIKRGNDLLTRGAVFELQQIEKINGTTIGPVQRRFAVPELGQGLVRMTPRLLGDATGQPGFQLRLLTVGDQSLEVIKVIREMTGLGLREAKAIVDSAPSDVPIGAMDSDTLRGFIAQLRALGARTEVLTGNGTVTPPADVRRRSLLLIASMALPELDEIGRKATAEVFEELMPKLVDVVADSTTKPNALREVVLAFLRRAQG
jgi:ribosomal protein L7/L12